MSGYIRAHIRINNIKEAEEFVSRLNADGTINKYILENTNGDYEADARSYEEVIAIMSDYADEVYFVNETEDGTFPSFINEYRVIA